MKTGTILERADVVRIADAAEAEANRNGWAVTIAIVDAGGRLLALNRLDGAVPISAHIAPATCHPQEIVLETGLGAVQNRGEIAGHAVKTGQRGQSVSQ
ncbi:MAG TPA: heme-binding protein [Pseudonocardiaceae bacterium]|nr:heme-binding protein [Pseudonocardiaceae bacterium]